ncbi:glycosyltransferase [Nannocystis sp. SCPEA4]|uniref:glycosyltransferase n=1 Tax=Nannocystis sp. SCPEA4 TaxID=2996787 RepID=UPI00226F2344|nr:glycosyltransferase [Nannocystis sp. SCPEA4]
MNIRDEGSAPDRDGAPGSVADDYDVLCVSGRPWGAPWCRQLLARCARRRRVFYVEAARATAGPPRLDFHRPEPRLVVATPYLPRGDHRAAALPGLLDRLIDDHAVRSFVLWHDSPQVARDCRQLRPLVTVYDRTDPRWAPFAGEGSTCPADLVFVSGHEVAAAEADPPASTHAFLGGADIEHFRRARGRLPEPLDQAAIPGPRLGVLGPIDADLDLELLAGIADLRADFQLVLLGGLRVRPGRLPRRSNIHYLGDRPHAQLPAYLAGWDVALLPYTRAREPERPLEYLAAGRPIVATPLPGVINPYGVQGLAAIADSPEEFVVAVECELRRTERRRWLQRVDAFLGERSWDRTWTAMEALISAAVDNRSTAAP